MPNMAQGSGKILNEDRQQPTKYLPLTAGLVLVPMQGKCRSDCVVYRATVTETMSGHTETYTGMTGMEFKDR